MKRDYSSPEKSPARPLRVVLTTRIYRPEASAASLRLGALVDWLRDGGAQVRVKTVRVPPRLRAARAQESDVSGWPVLRDDAGYVRGYLPYLSFDLPLWLRVLFGRSADVLICEPPPTTGVAVRVAAALRRTPYVYYAADIWSDAAAATGTPRAVLNVVRGMERFALRGARTVLAVSDGVRDRVRQLSPHSNIEVVGHGVDLTKFTHEGDVVATPADVVYVGSASEWHGAELALHALCELCEEDPQLTVAFVGQGTSWQPMQEEVQRRGLGNQIRFLGTVAPETAAAWLRGARVSIATLVPGKGYDFAVPTKLYASIAVGTPVAYAGPEPVRSMVADNFLGEASDYEVGAFTEAIRRALRSSDGRPKSELIAWAQENVSASTVARRSAEAVRAAAKYTR